MEPIGKIGPIATKNNQDGTLVSKPAIRSISQHGTPGRERARLRLYVNLYPSIGRMESNAKIGTAATKNNQDGTLVSKPAIRSISQHGTPGREPARLQLYTNLYPSIGGMEPNAKRGPAAAKNNQHGTLVSKPAMVIRSLSQHGKLRREPARLQLYTNLYPSTGGMEPIAKIGPAATKNGPFSNQE